MTSSRSGTHSRESALAILTGAVPLDSAFYVERSPIETDCYEAILEPGALIRVKGAQEMGKTSLLLRILHQAQRQEYQTALLDLADMDAALLQDLDRCLQWFCAQTAQALHLPDRLGDYWDGLFGSTISCKSYFEEYLLVQTSQPLVLMLDNVDRLFAYPDVADEFFGLLRAWHEEAKSRPVWQRLRLVVAHASEVYIPLNIHKSPFNVGMPIELTGFSLNQMQELASRCGFAWSMSATEALTRLVGGHPHLVQLTLHYLQQHQSSLEQLLSASRLYPIYHCHLQQRWQVLQQNSALAAAFAQVSQSAAPVELERTQALKLQSLGLVTLQGARAIPSCTLYARYFADRFNESGTE